MLEGILFTILAGVLGYHLKRDAERHQQRVAEEEANRQKLINELESLVNKVNNLEIEQKNKANYRKNLKR